MWRGERRLAWVEKRCGCFGCRCWEVEGGDYDALWRRGEAGTARAVRLEGFG
jgi:hypothetical protein